jgi:hypothetical protein
MHSARAGEGSAESRVNSEVIKRAFIGDPMRTLIAPKRGGFK